MQLTILGSGSAGNAAFLASGNTRILIDIGFSGARIKRRLERIGEKAEDLDAVIITHEHQDHCTGLSLAKRLGLPVFASRGTAAQLKKSGKRDVDFRTIRGEEAFAVGGLTLLPFMLPHDADEPLGFLIRDGRSVLGWATDLGYIPKMVMHRFSQCSSLVLEANHDLDTLRMNEYPWPLKQRIMGRSGHLSNDMMARCLKDLLASGIRQIFLAHLSKRSNHEAIVRIMVDKTLEEMGLQDDVEVYLADQDEITGPVEIHPLIGDKLIRDSVIRDSDYFF
jgi:phosphoribosyl 1,2-cyclic phosphodiesterase